MKRGIEKKILAGILGAFLMGGSLTAFAADAWTLPEVGVKLAGEAKNDYVAVEMGKFFRPQPGDEKPAAVKFEVPDGWSYDTFDLNGLKMEKVMNPSAEGERVILKFHGGGYVAGLHDRHRMMGIKQAVITDAKELYMVNYRLAPANPFPAALDDAAKAYSYILSQGTKPENIIVIGDSAGGNLALELGVYLKEKNMPQPGMMILVSPWVTLATDMPSRSYNAERDLVLGKDASPLYYEVLNPAYAKGKDVKDPHISPLYADLRGFCPMLIQVGGYELFLDECMELAKKAVAADVDVTLTVYPEMPHEFPLMMPELDDSVASFHELRAFVDRHMKD